MRVRRCAVPPGALLRAYVDRAGAYTDCFESAVPGAHDLRAYIAAFYSTRLFAAERGVLRLARMGGGDVRALAEGRAEHFAAWSVERRTADEILLRDRSGATRSYLAIAPGRADTTRLMFGSAVVPAEGERPAAVVRAILPVHRLYSRALLGSAARKLRSVHAAR